MELDTGLQISSLAVDGGATENGFLMQFQADILNLEVRRAEKIETTALGAAYLAGLALGKWTRGDLISFAKRRTSFTPNMSENTRRSYLSGWSQAVKKVLGT